MGNLGLFSLSPTIFGSLEFTPSNFIGLSLLPSLSVCTRLLKVSRSFVNRLIICVLLSMVRVLSSYLNVADDLLFTKPFFSLSKALIFFSNFAFSNKSVFPESIATYSEKFMPELSSILPSSMVRLPRLLFFS